MSNTCVGTLGSHLLTCVCCKTDNRKQIMDRINELGGIFTEMVENDSTFGAQWKNIPLVLLNKMLSCMPERDCARFFKEVKRYQKSLFHHISDKDIKEDMDIDGYEGNPKEYAREYTEEQHLKSLERTEDYLNCSISMEEWCKNYGIMLKFDPVERCEKWEECIYEVEKECDEALAGEHKGMGFCFSYWSTKKAVLAKYGIEWNSPAAMNPRVMFD